MPEMSAVNTTIKSCFVFQLKSVKHISMKRNFILDSDRFSPRLLGKKTRLPNITNLTCNNVL